MTSRKEKEEQDNGPNPFATMNMALWQSAVRNWIDIYSEFILNSSKITEYWFNLIWRPWIKEQGKRERAYIE